MDWSHKLNPGLEQFFGTQSVGIEQVSAHASKRQMLRCSSGKLSAIGVFTPEQREHKAFCAFTTHFSALSLPVPHIYWEDGSHTMLVEDLGHTTLYDLIQQSQNSSNHFNKEVTAIYHQVVQTLPYFQIKGAVNAPFDLCYPKQKFDHDNMISDMNYFEAEYLTRVGIRFDATLLKDTFITFADKLSNIPHSFFMYRDLQSRNIMVRQDKAFFIDYQGGRQGPLQYDLASLLYQSRAQLPQSLREELIHSYLEIAQKLTPLNTNDFLESLNHFVILRLMQVLGTYGKLGLGEKNTFFAESIPFAKKMLAQQLKKTKDIPSCTYLFDLLHNL